MKKSLVLAMAMALGVTASAYAANPFSDVPAGHWAYDSVAKLAAAGVVDGYADGAFAGDKLITRYEMAQIVAKAMAKGADCDKLAAEFADELDTLGVRVAKLEKGADAVKISAQIRANYRSTDSGAGDYTRFRTRLVLKGAINDDWTYTGRFENNRYFSGHDKEGKNYGDSVTDTVNLNWAYVSGKIGGVKVDLGRQDFKVGEGFVVDTRHEGVKAQYGKDVKLTVWAGKNPADYALSESSDRAYFAELAGKVGVVNAAVDYYKTDDKEIWAPGVALPLAKGVKLSAQYLKGDAVGAADEDGYTVNLAYKGAKASAPGSWGAWASYFDQPEATYLYTTIASYAVLPKEDGFEGFRVGANYALAKNIVAQVEYYDLEAREGAKEEETLWTQVTFSF